MKAFYKRAAPYADNVMSLPVRDVEAALPFYEKVFGFTVASRLTVPFTAAILRRDDVEIGLAENGGNPEQEGSFFEVDDVEKAWNELKANGLDQEEPKYRVDTHGDKSYKVFFVIAPDGLCYCIGEHQY